MGVINYTLKMREVFTLKTGWTAVTFCGRDTGQKPSMEQLLQTKMPSCLWLLLIGEV